MNLHPNAMMNPDIALSGAQRSRRVTASRPRASTTGLDETEEHRHSTLRSARHEQRADLLEHCEICSFLIFAFSFKDEK